MREHEREVVGFFGFATGEKKEREKKRRGTRRCWGHVGSIREKRKGKTVCHVGKGKRREKKRVGEKRKGFLF